MSHFSLIPKAEIPRSVFNMSHTYKTTFDASRLVPFFIEEVYPGDSWTCDVSAFCRLAAPLQVPIMDNLFFGYHFFFVPNRLTWEHWEEFNGANKTGAGIQSTDYLIPTLGGKPASVEAMSVLDFAGIPVQTFVSGASLANLEISALPFRAMQLIWNEFYRDENLQDPFSVDLSDASLDASTLAAGGVHSSAYPFFVGKKKDYFTTALPWPQKGPGVELPLGSTAPVVGNGYGLGLFDGKNYCVARTPVSGSSINQTLDSIPSSVVRKVGTSFSSSVVPTPSVAVGVSTDSDLSGLVADLSSATAASINTIRQAFQLQKLYERDARGGTRYVEILQSHFGVTSPDSRLQRPEYLGGHEAPFVVNTVAQNSSTDATTPQGNLAAFGVMSSSDNGFTRSFVEHGFIIGFCFVRSELTYQQGIRRFWTRRSRFDFYWPALAHLGEQAILNKEIYATGVKEQDEAVFGYQERWSELRQSENQITGKFRSTVSDSLDIWHLAQKFETLPTLSGDFIKDETPISRVSAVPSEPDFLLDVFFDCKATRPLPTYSVPGLVDHF